MFYSLSSAAFTTEVRRLQVECNSLRIDLEKKVRHVELTLRNEIRRTARKKAEQEGAAMSYQSLNGASVVGGPLPTGGPPPPLPHLPAGSAPGALSTSVHLKTRNAGASPADRRGTTSRTNKQRHRGQEDHSPPQPRTNQEHPVGGGPSPNKTLDVDQPSNIVKDVGDLELHLGLLDEEFATPRDSTEKFLEGFPVPRMDSARSYVTASGSPTSPQHRTENREKKYHPSSSPVIPEGTPSFESKYDGAEVHGGEQQEEVSPIEALSQGEPGSPERSSAHESSFVLSGAKENCDGGANDPTGGASGCFAAADTFATARTSSSLPFHFYGGGGGGQPVQMGELSQAIQTEVRRQLFQYAKSAEKKQAKQFQALNDTLSSLEVGLRKNMQQLHTKIDQALDKYEGVLRRLRALEDGRRLRALEELVW